VRCEFVLHLCAGNNRGRCGGAVEPVGDIAEVAMLAGEPCFAGGGALRFGDVGGDLAHGRMNWRAVYVALELLGDFAPLRYYVEMIASLMFGRFDRPNASGGAVYALKPAAGVGDAGRRGVGGHDDIVGRGAHVFGCGFGAVCAAGLADCGAGGACCVLTTAGARAAS